jgi:hypothetical protein
LRQAHRIPVVAFSAVLGRDPDDVSTVCSGLTAGPDVILRVPRSMTITAPFCDFLVAAASERPPIFEDDVRTAIGQPV